MKQYKVTRLFTDGTLKGLTHIAITTVKFNIGFISNHKSQSNYKILSCEEI